jgi:hypothetical protein
MNTPKITMPWKSTMMDGGNKELCSFEFNGRRYNALRDKSTHVITYVSKRTITNRRGVEYWPLKITGGPARKIIAALTEV